MSSAGKTASDILTRFGIRIKSNVLADEIKGPYDDKDLSILVKDQSFGRMLEWEELAAFINEIKKAGGTPVVLIITSTLKQMGIEGKSLNIPYVIMRTGSEEGIQTAVTELKTLWSE